MGADGPEEGGVLSSAARADLAHFSPGESAKLAGGGFDLGNSLSGLTGVLKRKENSATPGPQETGDEGGAPLAPQKQQHPQVEDAPPSMGFDDMPEEPDWDEMAMMELVMEVMETGLVDPT